MRGSWIAFVRASPLALALPLTLAFAPPCHGAFWEYRFTGMISGGTGIGIGIFDGVDGADSQGASFSLSAVFDDTSFAYAPPNWTGTYWSQEMFYFPTVSLTISRNGRVLPLNGTFSVMRNSFQSELMLGGGDGNGGTDSFVLQVLQMDNPLPIHPNPLAFTPFSGGSGAGVCVQYGAASLGYQFNDASLTLVPAPSAAALLALAGLTVRGRRRK